MKSSPSSNPVVGSQQLVVNRVQLQPVRTYPAGASDVINACRNMLLQLVDVSGSTEAANLDVVSVEVWWCTRRTELMRVLQPLQYSQHTCELNTRTSRLHTQPNHSPPVYCGPIRWSLGRIEKTESINDDNNNNNIYTYNDIWINVRRCHLAGE